MLMKEQREAGALLEMSRGRARTDQAPGLVQERGGKNGTVEGEWARHRGHP